MSELILRITGEIKKSDTNKLIGSFEIVSYDKKAIEKNPHPDRIHAHLTTKDLNGKIKISEKGVIAGINDPAQPLTFAIAVETLNNEIEYAGIMVLFNEKKKFKGRMFPAIDSILVACAKEEETLGKMRDFLRERKKRELKLTAQFDAKNTKIMISIYNANAVNLLQDYNNATVDDLSYLR